MTEPACWCLKIAYKPPCRIWPVVSYRRFRKWQVEPGLAIKKALDYCLGLGNNCCPKQEKVPIMTSLGKEQQLGEALLLAFSVARLLLTIGLVVAWRVCAESLPVDPLSKRLVSNSITVAIVLSFLLMDKGLRRYLR